MPFLPSFPSSPQCGRCHATHVLFASMPCCWTYELFCLLGCVELSCYECSCFLSPSARGSSLCFSGMFLFWALMCTTSAWRQSSSSHRTDRFNVLVVQPVPADTLTWRCPAGAPCPISSAQWLWLEQCVGRAREQRPDPPGWRPHYCMLTRNNTLPVLLVMLQPRPRPAGQAWMSCCPPCPPWPSQALVLPTDLSHGFPYFTFDVSYQPSILYLLWPQIWEFTWTLS